MAATRTPAMALCSYRLLARSVSRPILAARPAPFPAGRINCPKFLPSSPDVVVQRASGHRSFSTSPRTFSNDDQSSPAGAEEPVRPRRSLLYVPGSDQKKIKSSQKSPADCLIFDLEDSVAPHRKGAARETVLHALNAAARPGPELAVRINPPSGDSTLASDDLDVLLPSRQLETIIMPKVESEQDIRFVMERAQALRTDITTPLSLIISVESAASLLNMPRIIEGARAFSASNTSGPAAAVVSAILFASEDYCASTGIIRTRSRRELLFPRAQVVTIAKAYGLSAIDMVCIDYKDMEYLQDESKDGRELGFDGKQAIHPAQVEGIQRAYSPSEKEIHRAARIKHLYERSIAEHKGAYGLSEGDSMIMIDAPVLKQADATLAKARAADLTIPDVSSSEK